MAGSKIPIPATLSKINNTNVIPKTGVAKTWIIAVAYNPQTNKGNLNHVKPGARNL